MISRLDEVSTTFLPPKLHPKSEKGLKLEIYIFVLVWHNLSITFWQYTKMQITFNTFSNQFPCQNNVKNSKLSLQDKITTVTTYIKKNQVNIIDQQEKIQPNFFCSKSNQSWRYKSFIFLKNYDFYNIMCLKLISICVIFILIWFWLKKFFEKKKNWEKFGIMLDDFIRNTENCVTIVQTVSIMSVDRFLEKIGLDLSKCKKLINDLVSSLIPRVKIRNVEAQI